MVHLKPACLAPRKSNVGGIFHRGHIPQVNIGCAALEQGNVFEVFHVPDGGVGRGQVIDIANPHITGRRGLVVDMERLHHLVDRQVMLPHGLRINFDNDAPDVAAERR